MKLSADQLKPHLTQGLKPLYLVTGDEPLLVDECCQAIRTAAQNAGYGERQIHTVETGFDWSGWYESCYSLSLFSERRVIELRLTNGKPGESGAKVLTRLAAELPADSLVLINIGKIERQGQQSKWFKALAQAGAWVVVYAIPPNRLPAWINQRIRAQGLVPATGVGELLAHYMEGNLLACAQEIERLPLLSEGPHVSVDDIQEYLSDNARFTVFALADAALGGDRKAVGRILRRLRSEASEPVLILWALTREIRQLALLATALEGDKKIDGVLRAHGVWPRRQPVIKRALDRGGVEGWRRLLQQAATVDRVIKGRRSGDAWMELESLAQAIAAPGLTWTYAA
jgi:DNA polymerase III subunit delta